MMIFERIRRICGTDALMIAREMEFVNILNIYVSRATHRRCRHHVTC